MVLTVQHCVPNSIWHIMGSVTICRCGDTWTAGWMCRPFSPVGKERYLCACARACPGSLWTWRKEMKRPFGTISHHFWHHRAVLFFIFFGKKVQRRRRFWNWKIKYKSSFKDVGWGVHVFVGCVCVRVCEFLIVLWVVLILFLCLWWQRK